LILIPRDTRDTFVTKARSKLAQYTWDK
jgi:hypothetical protein